VQVEARRAEFAVNVPFVFVDEHRAARLDILDFSLHASQDFRRAVRESRLRDEISPDLDVQMPSCKRQGVNPC